MTVLRKVESALQASFYLTGLLTVTDPIFVTLLGEKEHCSGQYFVDSVKRVFLRILIERMLSV